MFKVNETSYNKNVYKGDAYYVVRWSKYLKYNKYEVLKKIPKMPGIYVVFFKNEANRLVPFFLSYSWVNSIMYELNFILNQEADDDMKIKLILEKKDCYYKYVIIESYKDMLDVYEYLQTFYRSRDTYFIKKELEINSGRYNNIFVQDYAELIKKR